jgi:hypothetical protein
MNEKLLRFVIMPLCAVLAGTALGFSVAAVIVSVTRFGFL